MVQDVDERDIHYGRKEGWSYPSRAFGLPEQRMRIVTQAIDTDRGLRSAKIKDEVVLRVTPGERYEIKATLVETDRSVQVLTIQKYNARSGPSDKFHFSFLPHEVERLAQLFITLEEEGYTKERQVVFNVSALGLVQPVTLIPHTGRKIPDFKIDEVAPDHYEGVIVDFIDQCVSKKP